MRIRSPSPDRARRRADQSRLRPANPTENPFRPEEVACAIELLEAVLDPPEGNTYEARILVDEEDRRLLRLFRADAHDRCHLRPVLDGHLRRGRGQGHGRHLLAALEPELREGRARNVRVETSSLEGQGGALRFYERAGYGSPGRIADFYRPGDDHHARQTPGLEPRPEPGKITAAEVNASCTPVQAALSSSPPADGGRAPGCKQARRPTPGRRGPRRPSGRSRFRTSPPTRLRPPGVKIDTVPESAFASPWPTPACSRGWPARTRGARWRRGCGSRWASRTSPPTRRPPPGRRCGCASTPVPARWRRRTGTRTCRPAPRPSTDDAAPTPTAAAVQQAGGRSLDDLLAGYLARQKLWAGDPETLQSACAPTQASCRSRPSAPWANAS